MNRLDNRQSASSAERIFRGAIARIGSAISA
jgi:hypothetical protein